MTPGKPSVPPQPPKVAASPSPTPGASAIGKYGWGASPKQYAQRKGACIGFFGAGKMGKTSTVGGCIRSELASPLLILSANANTDSLASLGDEIEVIPITEFKQIEPWRRKIVNEQGKFPFKSVALDVVSDMLALDEEAIYGTNHDTSWDEYNAINADMKQLTRNWRILSELPNLMLNVFFVLWERPEKFTVRGVEAKGAGRAGLALNTAMKAAFPGMIPFLGHIGEGDLGGLTKLMDFRTVPLEHAGGWNLDQRSAADAAVRSIPREIYYGVNDAPLADLVNSIKGGELFPAEQYTSLAALARAKKGR